ncbi:unnamed protein product [Protopolystoma xenopodis]|uniref:ADP/ATP translocase n=1 Tax=Protopolystoma xenopodis TaxID=117903 RepID=A0A448X7U2_9PLAT|nr:unnamed protein product [Protopolystoma xenopodis]
MLLAGRILAICSSHSLTGDRASSKQPITSCQPSVSLPSVSSSAFLPTANLHPPTYIIPLLAAFSATFAIVATYPASLIRSKLQAQLSVHSRDSAYLQAGRGHGRLDGRVTATGLLRTILVNDGPKGLYRGLGTNLAKVLPATGISLATLETVRQHLGLGPLGSG